MSSTLVAARRAARAGGGGRGGAEASDGHGETGAATCDAAAAAAVTVGVVEPGREKLAVRVKDSGASPPPPSSSRLREAGPAPPLLLAKGPAPVSDTADSLGRRRPAATPAAAEAKESASDTSLCAGGRRAGSGCACTAAPAAARGVGSAGSGGGGACCCETKGTMHTTSSGPERPRSAGDWARTTIDGGDCGAAGPAAPPVVDVDIDAARDRVRCASAPSACSRPTGRDEGPTPIASAASGGGGPDKLQSSAVSLSGWARGRGESGSDCGVWRCSARWGWLASGPPGDGDVCTSGRGTLAAAAVAPATSTVGRG